MRGDEQGQINGTIDVHIAYAAAAFGFAPLLHSNLRVRALGFMLGMHIGVVYT